MIRIIGRQTLNISYWHFPELCFHSCWEPAREQNQNKKSPALYQRRLFYLKLLQLDKFIIDSLLLIFPASIPTSSWIYGRNKRYLLYPTSAPISRMDLLVVRSRFTAISIRWVSDIIPEGWYPSSILKLCPYRIFVRWLRCPALGWKESPPAGVFW